MERNNADVMKKMQYILNMRPVLNTEALFSDGSDYYRCPSNPKAGEKVTVLSSGFEGYEIGEVGAFCTLPRRILNAPLRDLGITAGKVTDAIVGEALLKKGYGSEEMKPEEVTQSCLAQ